MHSETWPCQPIEKSQIWKSCAVSESTLRRSEKQTMGVLFFFGKQTLSSEGNQLMVKVCSTVSIIKTCGGRSDRQTDYVQLFVLKSFIFRGQVISCFGGFWGSINSIVELKLLLRSLKHNTEEILWAFLSRLVWPFIQKHTNWSSTLLHSMFSSHLPPQNHLSVTSLWRHCWSVLKRQTDGGFIDILIAAFQSPWFKQNWSFFSWITPV